MPIIIIRTMRKRIQLTKAKLSEMIRKELHNVLSEAAYHNSNYVKLFANNPEIMRECARIAMDIRSLWGKIDNTSWDDETKNAIDRYFMDAIDSIEQIAYFETENNQNDKEV